jgi:excisionase family DNA binding protein
MTYQYQALYTVKEATKLLRMGERYTRQLIRDGELPAIRLGSGGYLRIRGIDLESYINSRETVRDIDESDDES